MAVLKYTDPVTGEVKKIGLPTSDSYNKDEQLSNETKALLGLDDDATPDDVVRWLAENAGSTEVHIGDTPPEDDSIIWINTGDEGIGKEYYDKDETLSNATKSALGLGENATPNDAFGVLINRSGGSEGGEGFVETDPTVPAWAKAETKPSYTAEEVGAAPAGFGLGDTPKQLTSADDLNTVTKSGWYYWGQSAPANAPYNNETGSAYHWMRVDGGGNEKEFTQTAFNMYSSQAGVTMQRTFVDGGATNWEYVNPLMKAGLEYRTTERMGGKAVYKRNNNSIIEYRLDGETEWKPYADAVGALNASNTKVISTQASLSSPGWYRIAFANSTTTTMSISISSGYNNNAPMHLFADIALNAYRPKILIKTAHSSVIDKIRIVNNPNDDGCYLDVYYTDSAANPVQFNAVCLSRGTVEERDFVPVDETVDGETVVSTLEDIKSMVTALESNGYVLTDRSGVKKSGDTMTGALEIKCGDPKTVYNNPTYASTIGEVGAVGTGIRLTNRKQGGTYNSLVVSDPDSSLDEALKLLYQDKALYNILHSGNVSNYAAPAGFGLGEASQRLTSADDLNNVFKNGFYSWYLSTCPVNAPTTAHAYMLVSNWHAGGSCRQLVTNTDGTMYQRFQVVGTWTDWDCVNPPMNPNTEYRTTERIGTKAVYKRNNNGVIEYRLDGETTWKPYAQAVGALATDGSNSMTSSLVFGSGYGAVNAMKNLSQLEVRTVANDMSNRRVLRILSSSGTSLVSNALKFFDIVNGEQTEYDILHSGNVGSYAAPVGFGLGEDYNPRLNASELAAQNRSGWNFFYDTENPVDDITYGAVVTKGQNPWVGGFYSQEMDTRVGNAFERLIRYNNSGLTAWAYDIPAMLAGKEYRTTDSINGKSVFKRYNNGIIEYRLDGETTWKPYAQAVGGLATDGSNSMTSDLVLSNRGRLRGTANGVEIGAYDTQGLKDKERQLVIMNGNVVTSPKSAVRLRWFTGAGAYTDYDILHTGNVIASATDITAGSSASWQQYHVYE